MKDNLILTIEDFVDISKDWNKEVFLEKAILLKNRLKECYNLGRGDFGYEQYKPYNQSIGELIDQLRTLIFRANDNIYNKPYSETWEQYLVNREILRRFFPDFECPYWADYNR